MIAAAVTSVSMNLHSNFAAQFAELVSMAANSPPPWPASASASASACTSTIAPTQRPWATLAELEAVIRSIPPEPIGEFMRSNGRDPDDGWVLMLPKGHPLAEGFLPRYAKVSSDIAEPMLIMSRTPLSLGHLERETDGPQRYRPLRAVSALWCKP